MSEEQLKKAFTKYNAEMRRLGAKTKTWEQFLRYVKGNSRYKPKGIKKPLEAERYIRPSPSVPSENSMCGHTYAKTEKKYTGTKLLGIATMHKSNMVPVFSQEDAEEISKMRRN